MSVTSPARAKRPSKQIVAQHRVLGHAPGQDGLEGVHVVDAFAGIGPLAEEILVHVGRRAGIGIDPRGTGGIRW